MDPLREHAIHHERIVKIICIGAGASGLCLAYKLQRSFTNFTLTVYDKNAGVGGTWFENRYPGCACDVPAHNYTYSFEPKADFTSVLSPSNEIRGYFNDFSVKYGLSKYIRLSHMVTKTEWDPSAGRWDVSITDLTSGNVSQDWCHILVHATGYLNKPAWPNVPGIDRFQGIKLHSAQWDENTSLEGKSVLLVGSGASSVQILPAIQPIVKSVKVFVRTPRWTLPSVNSKKGKFSPQEIEKLKTDPEALMSLRTENERTLNSFFTMYMKGTVLQEQARKFLRSEMEKVVVDPIMREKMVPDFPVGCKRILPSGDQFLRTIKENNVHVVYAGVTEFTRTGCITEDEEVHDADVIICATGFDTSFIPRYPVIFTEHDVQQDWSETITGYMGVGISECPNSFTLAGPWTPISNGPVLVALEAQADFVCSFIDKYQTEPALHSMRLKSAVCSEFSAYVGQVTNKMVWSEGCRNSHNIHSNWGQSSITWPGSSLHYLEALREPRFEDYTFEYHGNRFTWMGNGVSQVEWDAVADLAYYIRDVDDGKHLSRSARRKVLSKSGTQAPRELHRQGKLTQA